MENCIVRLLLLIYILKCYQCSKFLLPDTVIPSRYDLKLITFLNGEGSDSFTYRGEVNIDVKCAANTNKITLHSHGLNISTISVKESITEEDLQVKNFDLVEKYDFLNIYMDDVLEQDEEYTITIEFKGSILQNLVGYYRSSYINEQNETIWMATTQFEPTYARYAFPCFDEPAHKAKFTISIGHKKHLTSISNMPKKETVPINIEGFSGYVLDVFDETVPMSTYLVAFIISDFVYESSSLEYSRTPFRIWARKNAVPQIQFAKEVGPKSLTFYENFFNIPYPLPKQDMIAIPDFSSGAMENWGLITYRETALLYDPKTGTVNNLQRVAEVICHELAHQWFGNLVTMKWWSDLWLNEGFATYMATMCVDNLFPEWKSMKQQIMSTTNSVFSLDSLKSSHPISVPVEDPYKIAEIFDAISYKKGSTIIRMMGNYLGLKVLRKGVSNYLKEHAYDNAEQDDLWQALTEVAHSNNVIPNHVTIKHIMDTWTLQTGYPVIYVERDYKDKTFTVKQKRFFAQYGQVDAYASCWYIPLTFTESSIRDFNNTKARAWLTCPQEILKFRDTDANNWIIFNLQQSGLYRVNYDLQNWDLLIKQLNSDKYAQIEEINRCLLISDVMTLAKAGEVDYEVAFRLINYIKREKEYLPRHTAFAQLGQIASNLERTNSFELIKGRMREFVGPMFIKQGGFKITSAEVDAIQFQSRIIRTACYYGIERCVANAVSFFKLHMKNPDENIINQNLLPTVLCYGIKSGTIRDWNLLWGQYKKSNVAAEKTSILRALGCSNDTTILHRYLTWILDEKSGIRKHDASLVFNSVAYNEAGFEIAKSFLYTNGQILMDMVKPKGTKIGYYLDPIASNLKYETEYTEFKEFLNNTPELEKYAKLAVKQAIEKIEINIQWHTLFYDDVTEILEQEIL